MSAGLVLLLYIQWVGKASLIRRHLNKRTKEVRILGKEYLSGSYGPEALE